MISFYPGPSKVEERVPAWTRRAYQKGVLSANHRSPQFMGLYRETEKILKKRLNIPSEYKILFTSSATECWEIIAQSLVEEKSHHFFNGAFGKKWFNYTRRIRPEATGLEFDINRPPDFSLLPPNPRLICLTQNETSNGTQVPTPQLRELRSSFPQSLIAIDATSSMGGIKLPFDAGDVWYASVQKCFGLPAGMALMICSPRAVDRTYQMGEADHYNSLTFILDNAAKFQTQHTPNVLNIFLLGQVMKSRRKIKDVNRILHKRMEGWIDLISSLEVLAPLVENTDVRSDTVLAVRASPEIISRALSEALRAGFQLGKGYGDLRESTFRIANFPALKETEIRKLSQFLQTEFGKQS